MTLYCYVQNLWTQLLLINSILNGERLWLKSLLTSQGNLLAREENELKIQMVWRSPRKEPPAVGTVQKRQSQGWKQIQKMKGIPGAKLRLSNVPGLPGHWLQYSTHTRTERQAPLEHLDLQLEPWAVSSERSENKFCMHASPCLTLAQKLLQMLNEGTLGSRNMANLVLLQWRLIATPAPCRWLLFEIYLVLFGDGVGATFFTEVFKDVLRIELLKQKPYKSLVYQTHSLWQQPKLAWNSKSSCLSLLRASIWSMSHPAIPTFCTSTRSWIAKLLWFSATCCACQMYALHLKI